MWELVECVLAWIGLDLVDLDAIPVLFARSCGRIGQYLLTAAVLLLLRLYIATITMVSPLLAALRVSRRFNP